MIRDPNMQVVLEAVEQGFVAEERFWLAFAMGDLDSLTRDFFRCAVEQAAELWEDLISIEKLIDGPPGARYSTQAASEEIRTALESSTYLVRGEPLRKALLVEEGEDTVTDIVLEDTMTDSGRAEPHAC